MEESVFKAAVAAISSGEYSESDIRTVRERLNVLNKEELALKRKMEKEKNAFVKAKDKSASEIKSLRKDIREIKNILKNL